MPTQIQGLVTPVYEPVVTVPATSEVITEAALTDTALALANRIEYVRQLVLDDQDPLAISLIREDFFGVIWDSSAATLTGSFTWRTSFTGSPVVVGNGGSVKNPGQLRITSPGGATNEFRFFVDGAAHLPFQFSSIDVTFVVALDSDATTASTLTFGVTDGATGGLAADDAILISSNPAVNGGNYSLVIRDATVQTTIPNILPYAADTFVIWRIVAISGGDVEIYAGSTLVHTIDAVDRPGGGCNVALFAGTTAADAGNLEIFVDLIAVKSAILTRAGAV